MLRSVDITNEINIRLINWRLNVLSIATYSESVNVATNQSLFFFCLRFIQQYCNFCNTGVYDDCLKLYFKKIKVVKNVCNLDSQV